MSPAFERGDILLLTMYDEPSVPGDICVFKLEGREIPIVHRVIKVHEDANGERHILTKGDNNELNDRGLYNRGQKWLHNKDIVGRVSGYFPYMGMITILLNDYPALKKLVVASIGLFVVFTRE